MEMLRAIWNEDFLPAMTELEEQQIDGAGPHRFDEVESELAAAVGAIDIGFIEPDSTTSTIQKVSRLVGGGSYAEVSHLRASPLLLPQSDSDL